MLNKNQTKTSFFENLLIGLFFFSLFSPFFSPFFSPSFLLHFSFLFSPLSIFLGLVYQLVKMSLVLIGVQFNIGYFSLSLSFPSTLPLFLFPLLIFPFSFLLALPFFGSSLLFSSFFFSLGDPSTWLDGCF